MAGEATREDLLSEVAAAGMEVMDGGPGVASSIVRLGSYVRIACAGQATPETVKHLLEDTLPVTVGHLTTKELPAPVAEELVQSVASLLVEAAQLATRVLTGRLGSGSLEDKQAALQLLNDAMNPHSLFFKQQGFSPDDAAAIAKASSEGGGGGAAGGGNSTQELWRKELNFGSEVDCVLLSNSVRSWVRGTVIMNDSGSLLIQIPSHGREVTISSTSADLAPVGTHTTAGSSSTPATADASDVNAVGREVLMGLKLGDRFDFRHSVNGWLNTTVVDIEDIHGQKRLKFGYRVYHRLGSKKDVLGSYDGDSSTHDQILMQDPKYAHLCAPFNTESVKAKSSFVPMGIIDDEGDPDSGFHIQEATRTLAKWGSPTLLSMPLHVRAGGATGVPSAADMGAADANLRAVGIALGAVPLEPALPGAAGVEQRLSLQSQAAKLLCARALSVCDAVDASPSSRVYALYRGPSQGTSPLYAECVTAFGRCGGFAALLAVLQEEPETLCPKALKCLVEVVGNMWAELNVHFGAAWLPAFTVCLRPHAMHFDDKQDTKTPGLLNVMKHLKKLLYRQGPDSTVGGVRDAFLLSVAEELFSHTVFSRRMAGLRIILAAADSLRSAAASALNSTAGAAAVASAGASGGNDALLSDGTSVKRFVRWLKSHAILPRLLAPETPLALLQRLSQLLQFMAHPNVKALDDAGLRSLVDAAVDHGQAGSDNAVIALCKAIGEASVHFDAAQQEMVIQSIASLPPSTLATHHISLIFKVARKRRCTAGTDALWALASQALQPSAGATATPRVSAEVQAEAEERLVALLSLAAYVGDRERFCEQCLTSVTKGQAVPFALRMMRLIVMSFPPHDPQASALAGERVIYTTSSRSSVLTVLNNKYDLLRCLLLDMEAFVAAARTQAAAATPEAAIVYNQGAGAGEQFIPGIIDRLDFLQFTLYTGAALALTPDQAAQLWAVLISEALSEEQAAAGLRWFTHAASCERRYRLAVEVMNVYCKLHSLSPPQWATLSERTSSVVLPLETVQALVEAQVKPAVQGDAEGAVQLLPLYEFCAAVCELLLLLNHHHGSLRIAAEAEKRAINVTGMERHSTRSWAMAFTRNLHKRTINARDVPFESWAGPDSNVPEPTPMTPEGTLCIDDIPLVSSVVVSNMQGSEELWNLLLGSPSVKVARHAMNLLVGFHMCMSTEQAAQQLQSQVTSGQRSVHATAGATARRSLVDSCIHHLKHAGSDLRTGLRTLSVLHCLLDCSEEGVTFPDRIAVDALRQKTAVSDMQSTVDLQPHLRAEAGKRILLSFTSELPKAPAPLSSAAAAGGGEAAEGKAGDASSSTAPAGLDKTFKLSISNTRTLRELRGKIAELAGLPTGGIRLVYSGGSTYEAARRAVGLSAKGAETLPLSSTTADEEVLYAAPAPRSGRDLPTSVDSRTLLELGLGQGTKLKVYPRRERPGEDASGPKVALLQGNQLSTRMREVSKILFRKFARMQDPPAGGANGLYMNIHDFARYWSVSSGDVTTPDNPELSLQFSTYLNQALMLWDEAAWSRWITASCRMKEAVVWSNLAVHGYGKDLKHESERVAEKETSAARTLLWPGAEDGAAALPRTLLSSQAAYDAIFDVLSTAVGAGSDEGFGGLVADASWRLLQRLPSHPSLRFRLTGLGSDRFPDLAAAAGQGEPSWQGLLLSSATTAPSEGATPLRLTYALQLVEPYVQTSDEGDELAAGSLRAGKQAWRKQFLLQSGFTFAADALLAAAPTTPVGRQLQVQGEGPRAVRPVGSCLFCGVALENLRRSTLTKIVRFFLLGAMAAGTLPQLQASPGQAAESKEGEAWPVQLVRLRSDVTEALTVDASMDVGAAAASLAQTLQVPGSDGTGGAAAPSTGAPVASHDDDIETPNPIPLTPVDTDTLVLTKQLSTEVGGDMQALVLDRVHLPALSSALRHIIWTAAGGLAPGIVNLADSAQLLEAALSLWVGVISTSAALVEASVFGEADTTGGPDGPSMVKSGLLCKGVYGLAVRKEFAHALGEITRVQFADDPAGALRQRVFDTLLALMPGAGTSADPEQDTGHFAELFTVLTKTLSTILATGKSGDSARAVDMFDRFASSLLAHRSAEWDPVVLQGARSRGREVLEHTPYLGEWDAAAAGGPDALAAKLHTAGQDDGVLCGLLGLLTSLVRGNAALQSRAVSAHAEAAACVPQTAAKLAADADGSNLVELVFYACLLGVPGRPAGDSPPPKVKCQRSASRLAALDLLAALCEGHLQNTDRLMTVCLQPSFEGIPESAKGLSGHNPCTDTRGKSGYVGIRNLGAICYMLSVVQQLFGMPRVRQAFLDMPVSKPGEEADPLMERLSWVFNTLHLSDKAYVDIKSMVSTYTDRSGEAVDPSQQQDAIDFFDVLTDHIEQRLGADSDLASTIKDETQLRQLYDMVGEVPAAALPPDVVEGLPAGRDGKVIVRRRRRADPPALCTGCDVKNLNSLKDSLNKACEWSDVDYRWDEEAGDVEVPEDAKITTRQRLVLDGSLPPTLILQARRFQFDFETMQPDKLNTRFEFPRNLDMRPFTVHALEYDGTAEGEAPPAWHFHYEVSGVVVHRGTATHGHYFSFVRDRRREYREERGRIVPVSFDGEAEVHVRRVPPSEQCWYRADDTNVVEVTMSDTFLEAECFGGRKEEVQTTDLGAAFTRDVDNMSNAYLLFYSRVQPEEEGGCDVEPLVAASPTAQLARAANHSFAVERAVFSPELLSFAGSQMVRGLGEFGDAVPEHWFRLAFTWAFGVLAPSASNGPLEASVVPTLVSWLESSSPALAASGAKWVLDQVAHQPEMHLGQLLRSLDGSVRNSCMAVLCTAVQVYVASDLAAGDAASIEAEAAALTALRQGGGLEAAKAALGPDWRPCTFSRFLSAVLSMIPSAGQDWSRFEQFFGVLRCAALKTPVAFGRTLLAARGAVALLLHFYMAQGSPVLLQHSEADLQTFLATPPAPDGDVVVHWDIASGNALLPLMAGSPPPAFPYLDDPKKRLPLGTASLTPSWGPLLQIVAGTVAVSHSAGSADGACTLPALDKVMLGATRAPTAEGAAMFEAVQDGLALRRAAARAPSPPAAGAEPAEDTPAGAAMGADTPPGTAKDGATERECALEGNCVSGGDVAWDKARAVSQRMVDLCPSVPPHPMPVTTQGEPGDHALLHLWPADLRALAMPAVYTKALRKAAPAGRPAATAAEAVLGDKPGAAGEGVVHAVCVIATRLSVEAPGFSDMVLTEALQVLADCTRGQSDVLKEDEWLTHAGAVAAGEGSAAAAHSSTVTQWSAAWDVLASLVALQDSLQGQRVADVLGDTSLDGSKGVVAQAWQKRLDCAPTVATSSNRKTFDIVRRLLALSQAVPALLGPLATMPLQEPAHTTHAQWMVEHTRTLADYATTCASGSKAAIVQLAELGPVFRSLQWLGEQLGQEAGWAAPGEMQPPPVTRVVKHTKREDPGVVIVRQVEVTDPLDPKGPYLAFEITNQHEHARPLAARMNWRVVDAYRNYNYTFPQTDQEAVVPVGETVEVYRSYKVDPSLPFDSRFTEWSYTWKLV